MVDMTNCHGSRRCLWKRLLVASLLRLIPCLAFLSLVPTSRRQQRSGMAFRQQSSLFSSQLISSNWEGPKYNISLLLIDHYDSFTYNLFDYFAQLLVEPPTVIAKDAFDEFNPEQWKHLDGIVLSPGPGTPQEQPPLSHQAIAKNPHLPILGVCLGHQLMALHYGARVDRAPTPIHGQDHWITQQRSQEEEADDDTSTSADLFEGLPPSFRVVRYHSLAAYDLPDTLQVTARSQDDNVVQALQHAQNHHYGVQFHPESIGTQHGMALVENFCKIAHHHKIRKGQEPEKQRDATPITFKTKPSPSTTPSIKEENVCSGNSLKSRFQVVVHSFEAKALPEQVFEKIYGAEASHAVWLDSSSASTQQRGTVDIMAAPTSSDDIIEYQYFEENEIDILSWLEQELFGDRAKDEYGRRRPASSELAQVQDFESPLVFEKDEFLGSQLPFDYRGGFLGYLGYEVRYDTEAYLHQKEGGRNLARRSPVSLEKSSQTPTAAFFLARQSLVYHHPTQTWYMVGLLEEDQEAENILEWMKSTKQLIVDIPDEFVGSSSRQIDVVKDSLPLDFVPNRPKETYSKDIDRCHEYIRQGESYELCLTNQLEAKVPNASARSTLDLYKMLRRHNPAPYSGYFAWKEQNSNRQLSICCSSPERFMSVKRRQPHPEIPLYLEAEAKPIKGTAARVLPQSNALCRTESEEREDQRRARSLELSLKNRAENLMIVDLLRNDMSRVCQVGTVHVAKLMAIESFATVHQMVSTIRGTLATGANDGEFGSASSPTCIDLLRASFPGGSMTGAPKLRTMELLEDLEDGVERGPYAGSLGYISVNGCMDMNIIIRSAVVTSSPDQEEYQVRVGAGGAITALSDSEDEYDEMLLKSRAVVQAVRSWAAGIATPSPKGGVKESQSGDRTFTADIPESSLSAAMDD